MNNNEEFIVAQLAKHKIEVSIKSQLSRFKKNNLSEKNRTDLKNFNIRIEGNNWRGENGDKIFFLNQLSLEMSVHGFVQNYGANINSRKKGTRKRNFVRRRIPEFTKYYRKKHNFEIEPTDFISEALNNSGAINYTLKNITRIRTEQIFLSSFLPLSNLKT